MRNRLLPFVYNNKGLVPFFAPQGVIKLNFKVISSQNLSFMSWKKCIFAHCFQCFGNRCFATPPFDRQPDPIEISKQWHSPLLCLLTPTFTIFALLNLLWFLQKSNRGLALHIHTVHPLHTVRSKGSVASKIIRMKNLKVYNWKYLTTIFKKLSKTSGWRTDFLGKMK